MWNAGHSREDRAKSLGRTVLSVDKFLQTPQAQAAVEARVAVEVESP